jgi:hypothetical protein
MTSPRRKGSTLQTYHEGDINPITPRKSLGVQAMCDVILRVYVFPGNYTLAKQITEGCLTYRRVNKQALWGQPLGGRNPGLNSKVFRWTTLNYPRWAI